MSVASMSREDIHRVFGGSPPPKTERNAEIFHLVSVERIPQKTVARRFDVSASRVWQIAHKRWRKEILYLHGEGASHVQISKKLGIHQDYVRRVLRR